MSTYHFHLNDHPLAADDLGADFPDMQSAKREAVQMLVELLRNAKGDWEEVKVVVTNDQQLVLVTLRVSEIGASAL
jgi:hypothetical protein